MPNSARAAMLKSSYQVAKFVYNGTVGDLTADLAAKTIDGAQIGAILPIQAHAIFDLDAMVNQIGAGKEPLLVTGGWAEKTGIPGQSLRQGPDWGVATYNLEGLKAYGEAVWDSVDAFFDTVTDEQLDKEVQSPVGGTVQVGAFLGGLAIVHLSAHAGEIAALKGVHGVKGLPF
jgi:hypothetical protein